MTPKPKKLLFNLYVLIACFYLLPLIIFFIYALEFPHTFFFLAFGQLFIVFFLLFFRSRLIKKHAETDLARQDLHEKSNLLQAEIQKEEQTLESYSKKIINYSQLKDLTEHLSLSLSLGDTSDALSEEVTKLFGGEDITAILYLFQAKTGELGITSSQKGQMRINLKSKNGDMFDEWVVKTMQPLLIEDTKSDFRFDMEKFTSEEPRVIRSLISTPLIVGNRTLGILRVDSPEENFFLMEDLRFLTTIGDLAAVAIENAQLYEKVEELAIRDGLTGLYLRRYLIERIAEEISRQLRRKKELSFLMIDLDKFKLYNDRLGHVAGDIVLKAVAMILSETFREPGDLVCRYGGEEFAVLLPDCPKEKAIELAEEVRKKIKKQDIILRKQVSHITVSIGVATFPADAQVKDELIQKADQAMYEAKNKGRDRVCST